MYFQAKEKHLTPKKHYYPWRHNCFHVYPPSTVRELVSFGHVTWQDTLSKTILQSICDGRSEPRWSEEEVVYEGEGANHKLRINLGNKPLLLGGLGESGDYLSCSFTLIRFYCSYKYCSDIWTASCLWSSETKSIIDSEKCVLANKTSLHLRISLVRTIVFKFILCHL